MEILRRNAVVKNQGTKQRVQRITFCGQVTVVVVLLNLIVSLGGLFVCCALSFVSKPFWIEFEDLRTPRCWLKGPHSKPSRVRHSKNCFTRVWKTTQKPEGAIKPVMLEEVAEAAMAQAAALSMLVAAR